MNIKIKYHNNQIDKIQKTDKGDWFDLRAVSVKLKNPKRIINLMENDYQFKIGDEGMIALGFSMELPKGHEALVIPRSSTFKNYGIIMTNHAGLIDNSYNGNNDEWHFPFYCLTEKDCIKFNEKICQFRIQENQPIIEFIEVDNLENEDRNGFGSTGKN